MVSYLNGVLNREQNCQLFRKWLEYQIIIGYLNSGQVKVLNSNVSAIRFRFNKVYSQINEHTAFYKDREVKKFVI